ncbi:predicted protein [Chaetoceros tenuissimus]|uniref:Uncharacterized protein n=1 Tax=Chaetoceros tenuissimus TaxID=426638 RepID=A0AAD3CJZ5_9STRA|nr:predicted protein [Chaetoceros tenuissimus]
MSSVAYSELKRAAKSLLDQNLEPTLEAFQHYFPHVVKDDLQYASVKNEVDWFKCKHLVRQREKGVDVALVPFQRPKTDTAIRKKSRKRAAHRVIPSLRNEDASLTSLNSCSAIGSKHNQELDNANAPLEGKSRECNISPLPKKQKNVSISQEEHNDDEESPLETRTTSEDTCDNSLVVKKGQSNVSLGTSTESNLDETIKLRAKRSKPRMEEKNLSPPPFSKSILNIQESTSEASPPTLNSHTDDNSSSDKAGATDDTDKRVNIHTDCNVLATAATEKNHSPDAIEETREDLLDSSFRHDQNNTYSTASTNESETRLDSMTNEFMTCFGFEENNNLNASSACQYESATNILPSDDMSDELEIGPLPSFDESSDTVVDDSSGLVHRHYTSLDVTTMSATSSRASTEANVNTSIIAETPVLNELDDPLMQLMQGVDDSMANASLESHNSLETTSITTNPEIANTSLNTTAHPREEVNITEKKTVANSQKAKDDETNLTLVQAQVGDFAATTTTNERDVEKETNTESKSGSMMSTATNNTVNMDGDQPFEAPVRFLKRNDAKAFEKVKNIIQAMVDEGIEHTGIEFRKKYPSMTSKYERSTLSVAIRNFTRQKEQQLEKQRNQKIRREMINNSQTHPQMHQDYFSPHMHAFHQHSAMDPTYMYNQTAPIDPRTNILPGPVGFGHPPRVYNGDYGYTMPHAFPGPVGFDPPPYVYNSDYRYTMPRAHMDSANDVSKPSKMRYEVTEGQNNYSHNESNIQEYVESRQISNKPLNVKGSQHDEKDVCNSDNNCSPNENNTEEYAESLQISNEPLNTKGSQHDEKDVYSSDESLDDDTIIDVIRTADPYGEKYEAQEKHKEVEALLTDSVESNLGQEVTNNDEQHRSVTIHEITKDGGKGKRIAHDDGNEQSSSNDRDDHLDKEISSKSPRDGVNTSDSTKPRTSIDSALTEMPSKEIACEETNDDEAHLQHLEANIDHAMVDESVETSAGKFSENAVEVGEKNEVVCLDNETSSNQSENHTRKNIESFIMKSGGKTSSDRDQKSTDIDQQYNGCVDDIARQSEIIFLGDDDDDDDDDQESTSQRDKDANFEIEESTTSGSKKDSIFCESDSDSEVSIIRKVIDLDTATGSKKDSIFVDSDSEESTFNQDKDDDFGNKEPHEIATGSKNRTNNEDSTQSTGYPNSTHQCTSKESNTGETAATVQRKVFDELLKRKAISLADLIFEIIALSSNWLECQEYAEKLIKLGFYDEKMMKDFCKVEIVDSKQFASFMKVEHRLALKKWVLENGTYK